MEGLRVSLLEKTVFRRIFRPKIQEVTGGWRKLCSQYFVTVHNFSPNVSLFE